VWPGPDLRPSMSGAPETLAYGLLRRPSSGLVADVKAKNVPHGTSLHMFVPDCFKRA
jgi:hypothetical protein